MFSFLIVLRVPARRVYASSYVMILYTLELTMLSCAPAIAQASHWRAASAHGRRWCISVSTCVVIWVIMPQSKNTKRPAHMGTIVGRHHLLEADSCVARVTHQSTFNTEIISNK